MVCINKYDLNEANSRKIADFCHQQGIPVAGRIPYDSIVTEAMVEGVPVVEYSDGAVSKAIRAMWSYIKYTL